MNSTSLVSVICLCHNQAAFVREAIESVLNQTYSFVELIVVDDGSRDNSKELIRDIIAGNPKIQFVDLPENIGNCRAFNKGLARSKGEFIIDLAADDVLLPTRIESGLIEFGKVGVAYGVNFSDAEWISETGKFLHLHSDRFPHHTIPQGDVYKDVIARFFICPPTILVRRQVFDELGGYDETLSYEDFDFWIRSSRKFLYCYTPHVLVKKRVTKNSLSARQFRRASPQAKSTFEVCRKILQLNRTKEEKRALGKRVFYEISVCLKLVDIPLAFKYMGLWFQNLFTSVSGK